MYNCICRRTYTEAPIQPNTHRCTNCMRGCSRASMSEPAIGVSTHVWAYADFFAVCAHLCLHSTPHSASDAWPLPPCLRRRRALSLFLSVRVTLGHAVPSYVHVCTRSRFGICLWPLAMRQWWAFPAYELRQSWLCRVQRPSWAAGRTPPSALECADRACLAFRRPAGASGPWPDLETMGHGALAPMTLML